MSAATVDYDLTIARQEVNLTGHPVKAMTINSQLPGPTLHFTDGDHAVVRVHNQSRDRYGAEWRQLRVSHDGS